jgi:hypothetical protein
MSEAETISIKREPIDLDSKEFGGQLNWHDRSTELGPVTYDYVDALGKKYKDRGPVDGVTTEGGAHQGDVFKDFAELKSGNQDLKVLVHHNKEGQATQVKITAGDNWSGSYWPEIFVKGEALEGYKAFLRGEEK